MLHTCWCIAFECLNSNLYLNSFVWRAFKKIKTLSIYPSLSPPLSSPFLLWALTPEVWRCPFSFCARPPLHLSPAGPALQRSPWAKSTCAPLSLLLGRHLHSRPQPGSASDPPQLASHTRRRNRWQVAPTRHSQPSSSPTWTPPPLISASGTHPEAWTARQGHPEPIKDVVSRPNPFPPNPSHLQRCRLRSNPRAPAAALDPSRHRLSVNKERRWRFAWR
jgi:hypothetical protein